MAEMATERGHWYYSDGTPCHEVPYADPRKGTRPTTLKDAKKLGLVPSVTSINKMLAAPGLEKWKLRQAIMSALTLPQLDGESLDDYALRIEQDAREQGRKAAEKGTSIHAAVEGFYLGKSYEANMADHVTSTAKIVAELWPRHKFLCEKSCYHPMGYGGKVDLHSEDGDGLVIDFKTGDFSDTKQTYPEQARQLVAYREALALPDAVCANVFISTSFPGVVYVHIWDEETLADEWEVFKHLVKIWQITNKYKPGVV